MKKCLIVITARSGSKGLKDKNIKKIGGKSLIEFKYICAKKAKITQSDIFVSTDSEKYIQILKKKNIPYIQRPASLARDNTESRPVLIHCIEYLKKKGNKYSNLILLEPATPFTSFRDLNYGYKMFCKKKLDFLASVELSSVSSHFIAPMKFSSLRNMFKKINKFKKFRRQEFLDEYKMDGGFYIFKISTLMSNSNIFHINQNAKGYVVDRVRAINIENNKDYKIANIYYNNIKEIRNDFS